MHQSLMYPLIADVLFFTVAYIVVVKNEAHARQIVRKSLIVLGAVLPFLWKWEEWMVWVYRVFLHSMAVFAVVIAVIYTASAVWDTLVQ